MKTAKLVALLGMVCIVVSGPALIADQIPNKKCPPPPYGTTFCPATGQINCGGMMISCQNDGGSGMHCGQQITWMSIKQGPQKVGNTCQSGGPTDSCNQFSNACAFTYFSATCCTNSVCVDTSTQNYCL